MSLLSCGPRDYLLEMGDIFCGLSARRALLIDNTKAALSGKPYNFSGLLEGADKYGAEKASRPN
jgi:hypothetical protein